MPRPTSKSVAKWAAVGLLVLVVGYAGAYVAMGSRTTFGTRIKGDSTQIEFPSGVVAMLFVPAAVTESLIRRRTVIVYAETQSDEFDGWECEPLRIPIHIEWWYEFPDQ